MSVDYTAGDGLLLSASSDGTVRTWDSDTLAARGIVYEDTFGTLVSSAFFSRDGDRLPSSEGWAQQ